LFFVACKRVSLPQRHEKYIFLFVVVVSSGIIRTFAFHNKTFCASPQKDFISFISSTSRFFWLQVCVCSCAFFSSSVEFSVFFRLIPVIFISFSLSRKTKQKKIVWFSFYPRPSEWVPPKETLFINFNPTKFLQFDKSDLHFIWWFFLNINFFRKRKKKTYSFFDFVVLQVFRALCCFSSCSRVCVCSDFGQKVCRKKCE